MARRTYKFDVQAYHKLEVGGQVYSGGDLIEIDEDNPVIDDRFVVVDEPDDDPLPPTPSIITKEQSG